jgi:hypothetical protein
VLPEAAAPTKPKKAQPKGLRMRYRPSGFGPGNLGSIGSESDSDESMPHPPQSRRLPILNGPSSESPSKKRKNTEAEDRNEKTLKKTKRKDRETQEDKTTAVNGESAANISGQTNGVPKKKKSKDAGPEELATAVEKASKKEKKGGKHTDADADGDVAMVNSSNHASVEDIDEARRKEERKRRKREKQEKETEASEERERKKNKHKSEKKDKQKAR